MDIDVNQASKFVALVAAGTAFAAWISFTYMVTAMLSRMCERATKRLKEQKDKSECERRKAYWASPEGQYEREHGPKTRLPDCLHVDGIN